MKIDIPINPQTGKRLMIMKLANTDDMFVYTHKNGVADVSSSCVILSSKQLQDYITRVTQHD